MYFTFTYMISITYDFNNCVLNNWNEFFVCVFLYRPLLYICTVCLSVFLFYCTCTTFVVNKRKHNNKPSRRCAAGWLYSPARLSTPVSHAPGVTSRFCLARRLPRPLPPPAAGLRPSSVRARRLRPALACPTARVSYAAGQIHNRIIIYRL